MIILGIDPGKSGALAVVRTAHGRPPVLLSCSDVPIREDDRVDGIAVCDFIQRNLPDFAFIERAQAMPSLPDAGGARRGPGSTSMFNYGVTVGRLEMCVEGLGIPMKRVEVGAWKKAHALPNKNADGVRLDVRVVKENSRLRAIKLFPAGASFFARVRDHNRAEAALIAAYGWMLRDGG